MNNKLIRKLTLSAVTLGVAAISATTSTFAWFTTNGTVSASGVSGTVAASDANMLAKTLKENGATPATAESYSDFSAKPELHTTAKSNSLVPVKWDSDSFKKANGENNFTAATTDTDGEYLHYEVIFGISDLPTTNKTVKAAFTLAGEDGTQYLLANAGTGATAGKTIKVNLTEVLAVRTVSTVIENSTAELGKYGIKDTEADKILKSITSTAKNYKYIAETTKVKQSSDSADLEGTAHTYYENVYGLTTSTVANQKSTYDTNAYGSTISTLYNGSKSTKVDLFSVTGTETSNKVYVKTDIYIYIDGFDNQCFNAVGGLSLSSGSITFTLE